MAKRRLVSGRLKIEVAYNDRTSNYQVRLCPMVPRESCESVKVGTPKHITRAVDSPASLRSAARAAISFASDRIQEYATTDRGGSGWLVKSPRNVRGPRRRKR